MVAEAAEVSGDVKAVCPFGKPFFVGTMDTGKSFDLLPGHSKAEKAKIEAYRQVLTKCVSQYGKRTKFVLVGFVDPVLYQGRPEVHNGLNGGLAVTRAISAARLMRALGYEFTTTREVHGEDGERGVLVIPDLGLCSAEDINNASRIVDEITGQTLSKSSCKAITGQQLPAGRITKVKISLMGEETFDGSGKSVGLPTTKTCYVVVGDGGRVVKQPAPRQDPPAPRPVAKETKCSDGVDNDGDKLIDCADPDCEGSAVCGPEDTEARCKDGIDNDGDGFTDCDDKDCLAFEHCNPSDGGQKPEPPVGNETNCADGVDNDNDGKVDCEDSDCKGIFSCRGLRIGVTGNLLYDFVNYDAMNGQMEDEIKNGDLFNGKLALELKIPLKNGFSLVPAVEYFTTSSFWAMPGDEHLTKEVRQGHFGVQLTLLKKVAEDLEIGVGIGAGLHEDWGLPQFHAVARYMLDANWFIQGGVEMYIFRHPTEGGKVPVFAPFFGIGFLF